MISQPACGRSNCPHGVKERSERRIGRSETLAMTEIQRDITRGVLAVLFIVALIGSSIWILRPFLGAIVWATTIVVATWPLMIAAQAWLWGKRALAVTLMTLLLLCVLVVPLTFAIGTIVSNVDEIVVWVKSLASFKAPAVPQWIADLPLVGPKAVELWEGVAAAGIQEAAMRAAPYAGAFLNGLWRSWAASAYC